MILRVVCVFGGVFAFSAVLAHFILNERLHALGVLGCVMCIAGSVVIVIHAPQEQEITSVREIWNMAIQPGENYRFIMGVILFVSKVLIPGTLKKRFVLDIRK